MESFLEFLADDRYGWAWLFIGIPLAVFAWVWTHWARKNQLANWNLASTPTVPGVSLHVLAVTAVLGVAPLVCFCLVNWMSQYMTWPVFGANFGAWSVGATAGIATGVIGGRKSAERPIATFSTSLQRR